MQDAALTSRCESTSSGTRSTSGHSATRRWPRPRKRSRRRSDGRAEALLKYSWRRRARRYWRCRRCRRRTGVKRRFASRRGHAEVARDIRQHESHQLISSCGGSPRDHMIVRIWHGQVPRNRAMNTRRSRAGPGSELGPQAQPAGKPIANNPQKLPLAGFPPALNCNATFDQCTELEPSRSRTS